MKFQTLQDFMTAAGGRRYVLAFSSMVVYTALLAIGKLTGTEYVTLSIATVATYIGAGTYQKRNGDASKPNG